MTINTQTTKSDSPKPESSEEQGKSSKKTSAGQKEKASFGRIVAENIECLAIAIVMALILKFFLIEAYKIPSGSMQPTIMGDQDTQIFDRVLVNKMLPFLRTPRRWEVTVFKMPLVQRQNYIKRIVGLPGEKLRIRNGDLFVTPPAGDADSEAIARKPDKVWYSVRKKVVPDYENHSLAELFGAISSRNTAQISDDEIQLNATTEREAVVKLKRPIRDLYYHGYDPDWVPNYKGPPVNARYDVADVEVEASVRPESSAKLIAFEIEETTYRHRLELDCGSGDCRIETLGRNPGDDGIAQNSFVAEGRFLPTGKSTSVSFRNVDDELVFELDGSEVVRLPYLTQGDSVSAKTFVYFRASGGSITLSDVQIHRDIFYTPPDKHVVNGRPTTFNLRSAQYSIPEGEYFALGDNTQNSADCRSWMYQDIRLNDGTNIRGNFMGPTHPDANPKILGSRLVFENIYGQSYEFSRSDKAEEQLTAYHKIPEEFLLGKAMAVFWPVPPFSPSWRLKWVR